MAKQKFVSQCIWQVEIGEVDDCPTFRDVCIADTVEEASSKAILSKRRAIKANPGLVVTSVALIHNTTC